MLIHRGNTLKAHQHISYSVFVAVTLLTEHCSIQRDHFKFITYLLIDVVNLPKIEFPSSNSICHPSSPRQANEDDKKFFCCYILS